MVSDSVIREIQQRAEPNFRAWLEVVGLTLALKQAWLQHLHPELPADTITAMVYRELLAAKEQAWKTCWPARCS